MTRKGGRLFFRPETGVRHRPLPAADEALYQQAFPYYAELSALTEIRKKPGFGAPLNSGIGGHTLLYLNNVHRDRDAGYPTLKLGEAGAAAQGVGISVNAHYRNANWIAADGPDFLWRGALARGEPVTLEGYQRTQAHAKSLGLLNGVAFHRHLFRDKPAGMSDHDYMYEISIATDYAARFGRDIFRLRVPLDRARMAAIVRYLNDLNAPFRDGTKIFNWRVTNNNCVHVAHNALAAAGIWAPWPTGQFFAVAAFNFPVPKNAFVDLALRANDLPIADPWALYEDDAARSALAQTGALPTAPGALACAEPALPGDGLYDTDKLRVIFYDNPFWGPYRPRLARILSEPRYGDLRTNLRHFEQLYAAAQAAPRAAPATGAQIKFLAQYDRAIARGAAETAGLLAALDHDPEMQVESPL
jgi:hypothetical protein